jgi:hypothetical protein
MVATQWRTLSIEDKKKWTDAAYNPDICGNRWGNYI